MKKMLLLLLVAGILMLGNLSVAIETSESSFEETSDCSEGNFGDEIENPAPCEGHGSGGGDVPG